MAKKKTSRSRKKAKSTTGEHPVRKTSSKPQDDSIQQSAPVLVETAMDPSLQEVVLKHREGRAMDVSFSQAIDGEMIVDVIAKLNDPKLEVPGLTVVRVIGQICTGQVSVDSVERVRNHANVASLKLASKLHKNLVFSTGDIQATSAAQLAAFPPGTDAATGKGVIVGVVDYGCDLIHKSFRNPDGTTRLLFLWDQSGGTNQLSPTGFGYGREFNKATIDAALSQADPYFELKYDPGNASHGTHVMDIAAGNGAATGNAGVANEADLIFVNIAHDDIEFDEIKDLADGESINFGNSKMLLEAVDYIFAKAREQGRQAVVNISLGTHGGPHDGSTLAEQGFDTLLATSGRAIVIAAGNSHQQGGHASGTVSKNNPRELHWTIPQQDFTPNEVEIWYPAGATLSATLTTSSGTKLAPVIPGTTVTLSNPNGPVGRIVNRVDDPNNGDNQIDVILGRELKGDWLVTLSTDSTTDVPFHAWIERDDFAQGIQSRFSAVDTDASHTIGSISCGQRTIAVASYATSGQQISPFSAEGPTRDGKQKPEISAPGQHLLPDVGILAARSRSQTTVRKPGTSMAAPHVAGVIALLMQAAGRELSIDEIRTALFESTRRQAGLSNWDPRFGFGRIDATAALVSILSVTPLGAIHVATGNGTVTGSHWPDDAMFDRLLEIIACVANRTGSTMRVSLEVSPKV